MNFLKRFLLVVSIFCILIFIVSLFLPSSLKIERSNLINSRASLIFKQINDLKKWKEWSVWGQNDITIYKDDAFSNPSSGEEAQFHWESENEDVGEGFMKITKSITNKQIDYVVDFGMGETQGSMTLLEKGDNVEVIWSFYVDFGFNPISKFFGLFMEDYIIKDYDQGLKNLKSYVENLPQIDGSKVEVKRLDKIQWYLSVRDTINQMQMNNIHGKLYQEISEFMDGQNIKSSSAPIMFYHFWSDSIIDIEAGIPLKDSIFVENARIKLNKIDTGNVVTASHFGPYERLPETYYSINEWMRKNEVEVIGAPWEVYITDPAAESNPQKWETQIFFPIN